MRHKYGVLGIAAWSVCAGILGALLAWHSAVLLYVPLYGILGVPPTVTFPLLFALAGLVAGTSTVCLRAKHSALRIGLTNPTLYFVLYRVAVVDWRATNWGDSWMLWLLSSSLVSSLIGGTLGVYIANAWRRRWDHQPGHCRVCGYSLQGLPTNRCPECGTVFERGTQF